MKKKLSLSQLIMAIILLILTLTMIIPILNIAAKSFSAPEASRTMSGLRIIPKDFDLFNYKIVFSHPILVPAIINSVIITVVGTFINIFLTTTAAYVLTRPKLTLKRP